MWRAVSGDFVTVGEQLVDLIIEPTVHQQGGNPRGKNVASVEPSPVRVVTRRVTHPLLIEVERLAKRHMVGVFEREVRHRRVGARRLLRAHGIARAQGTNDCPRDRDVKRESATREPGRGPVGSDETNRHCLEIRRASARQRVLGEPHIAVAERSEIAVEPVLLRDPVSRESSVGGFREPVRIAGRLTRAATVLKDDPIAGVDKLTYAEMLRHQCLAVAGALHDRRKRPGAARMMDVGREHGTVGRGQPDVAFDSIVPHTSGPPISRGCGVP